MNKTIKILKKIVSIVFAIIISILVVGFTMRAVATFEFEMIPKLIVPIIIVAIPVYILIYRDLFNEKKRR